MRGSPLLLFVSLRLFSVEGWGSATRPLRRDRSESTKVEFQFSVVCYLRETKVESPALHGGKYLEDGVCPKET